MSFERVGLHTQDHLGHFHQQAYSSSTPPPVDKQPSCRCGSGGKVTIPEKGQVVLWYYLPVILQARWVRHRRLPARSFGDAQGHKSGVRINLKMSPAFSNQPFQKD